MVLSWRGEILCALRDCGRGWWGDLMVVLV